MRVSGLGSGALGQEEGFGFMGELYERGVTKGFVTVVKRRFRRVPDKARRRVHRRSQSGV